MPLYSRCPRRASTPVAVCIGVATTDLAEPNGADLQMVPCDDPTASWDMYYAGDGARSMMWKNRYATEQYGQNWVVLDLDTNNWGRPQLWEYLPNADNQIWDPNRALWESGNCYANCV